MKTSIKSVSAPNPLVPFEAQEHSNLCPEFAVGFDVRDQACVRCQLQLLCMHSKRARFYPAKVAEAKAKAGVKYFLDETRQQDFEDFYEEIFQACKEGNITDPVKVKEVVAKNQEEWLQLLDPEFPQIVLERILRDPRIKSSEGAISW